MQFIKKHTTNLMCVENVINHTVGDKIELAIANLKCTYS